MSANFIPVNGSVSNSRKAEFPDVDLQDDELSKTWLLAHFHPRGLKCPHCGQGREEARGFRKTAKSQLIVYRCNNCQGVYNLYSGTVFAGKHFRPAQALLLLRSISEGKPVTAIARTVGVSRQTVYQLRGALEAVIREDQSSRSTGRNGEDKVDKDRRKVLKPVKRR